MKEVRNRLNRDYRLQNQNLTKAVLSGAKVIEQVLVDSLTETAAYKLEYDKLREYVFAGKRDHLWNVIPASKLTLRSINI
jgi:DNA-binding transcriptional regulator WhiA